MNELKTILRQTPTEETPAKPENKNGSPDRSWNSRLWLC